MIHSDDFRQQRNVVLPESGGKRSFKAILACLLSLLFFVPLAPLLGLTLGLSSRGKAAGYAVLLGLVFTAGQAFVGYRGWGYYQQVAGGPAAALGAGFDGNFAAFNDAFASSSPAADVKAQAFIEELESRYGRLVSADLLGSITDVKRIEDLDQPRRYRLTFQKATLEADVGMVLDRTLSPTCLQTKLLYLKVHDPGRGDMNFPESASALVSQPADR